MILFVTDQVAGAEYIAPLLGKWKREGRRDWRVLASPASSACLDRNELEHQVLTDPTLELAAESVQRLSPDRAVVSTSVASALERSFVEVLTSRRIPCAQLVDNWVNYSRRFEFTRPDGSTSMLLPHRILTLDESAKQAMVAEGLPAHAIEIIGQPNWEFQWRSELERPVEARPGTALLITQPISQFFAKDLGYDELDFVRTFLESWRSFGFAWSMVDILVHPSESDAAYAPVFTALNATPRIVRGPDIRLGEYSLIAGMFSSMLIQGLLERVPTISVQPAAVGADRCFLSEAGFVLRMLSGSDLTDFLAGGWAAGSESTSDGIRRLESVVDGSLERLEAFLARPWSVES